MNPTQTRAILTIALLAAFADGRKHEREQAEIRRIVEGLPVPEGDSLAPLYQDVLLQRVRLADIVPALDDEASRQLAYEMAVCVCDADGMQSDREQSFLADLRRLLGLDRTVAHAHSSQAEALAAAPLGPLAADEAVAVPAPAPARTVDDAALDAEILRAAITTGALELLPETLSTLAIIPLQMKLVYRIGQAWGYELDQGHVKDFLATAGVGLTSQYLEQAGRKLLGGLLGHLGGAAGGLGRQAASSGLSFATTWALGQLARRYYAGGRVFSAELLRSAYADLLREAQALYATHLPAIQAQARSLDPGRVLERVRGG